MWVVGAESWPLTTKGCGEGSHHSPTLSSFSVIFTKQTNLIKCQNEITLPLFFSMIFKVDISGLGF